MNNYKMVRKNVPNILSAGLYQCFVFGNQLEDIVIDNTISSNKGLLWDTLEWCLKENPKLKEFTDFFYDRVLSGLDAQMSGRGQVYDHLGFFNVAKAMLESNGVIKAVETLAIMFKAVYEQWFSLYLEMEAIKSNHRQNKRVIHQELQRTLIIPLLGYKTHDAVKLLRKESFGQEFDRVILPLDEGSQFGYLVKNTRGNLVFPKMVCGLGNTGLTELLGVSLDGEVKPTGFSAHFRA